MQQFSLKCFGIGDGWASDRNHSSFLYRFPGGAVMIDCGEPVSRNFKTSGFSYDLVDGIFLSHFHFDHVGGFFMLMQSFWLEGRKKDLPVYLPADGIMPLRQTLETGCIFDELLSFRLRYCPLTAAEPITVGGIHVTPFRTTHLLGLQKSFQARYRHDFAAYCFLLETGGLRIGHSADVGASSDLAVLLEKPLDLLVCELAHMEPEDLFAFLKGKAIRRLVLIHLARQYWPDREAIKARAQKFLSPMEVFVPVDGDECCFS
jgi:ribonuclease BN (tRNA processing enzyme)